MKIERVKERDKKRAEKKGAKFPLRRGDAPVFGEKKVGQKGRKTGTNVVH